MTVRDGAKVERSSRFGAEETAQPSSETDRHAPYGVTLALTVTLAAGCFLVLMSAVLLVVHPPGTGLLATTVIVQNQNAKTFLFLAAFVAILPLALVIVPRLADAVTASPNVRALPGLAALLVATFAATIIFVRLSGLLPWGDGLGVVLVCLALWTALALGALFQAARPRHLRSGHRLQSHDRRLAETAGVLVIGTLVCVTSVGSLSALPLILGAIAVAAVVAGYRRLRVPRPVGRVGRGLDAVVMLGLLLAIPNVVVFTSSSALPNVYVEPGIIQFHQDWLLGPANQLLGGGALLVNVPVSQYGVGYIYLLAAWFHLVPIGYGTYGLLDGIVTALFYIAGFCLLRTARVPRSLAAATMVLAVVTLIYHLYYAVGALPQQGPLRFGLPMIVILAAAGAVRWPRRRQVARLATLIALGAAAVWSLEMLAYTLFVFAAVLAVQAWLLDCGARRRWLLRQAGLGLGACVGAHLILAGATLAATGRLPDWGQYLAYVDALVLGGQKAGGISYGFARWSPGLAVGAASLASAAAIVLLMRRARGLARHEPVALVAISGSTAYAIALLSYSDNRSSTYLLPYVALPTLLAASLWLTLLLRSDSVTGGRIRLGALASALSVAVLMLGAAWPAVDAHFADTALAHAYPGGGLGGAVRRLWHPPPIDPRAPGGEALLNRYAPGRRTLILLPDAPDLGTEILIRSHRFNRFSIGDPKADAFVSPSAWTGRLTEQIEQLRPGDRFLTDTAGLRIAASLRDRSLGYPLAYPLGSDNPQTEWILQRLQRRFALRPIRTDGAGLTIAMLQRR
jgi:hypothetical protein